MRRADITAVLSLFVLLAGTGAYGEPRYPLPPDTFNQHYRLPPDAQIACEKRGGAVRRAGLAGRESCIIPYPDAGKTCSDMSDCQGRCLYNGPESLKNTAVTGECAADSNPFGCQTWVEKGRITESICTD